MEAERVQQIAVLDAAEKGESIDSIDFTEIKNEFITRYKAIQEKRKQQISLKDTLERENLKLKKGLLDELKRIIESEEHIASAFPVFPIAFQSF